jgi:hypothetical protein
MVAAARLEALIPVALAVYFVEHKTENALA